ncbi:cobalt-precorrin-5B (C(1))-methyltransferase [Acidithrix sp. C25]|uniref:cobalt-precorrin-5B (C(1))-methyltransferase n=1 Tax=Acidithrix sp. C25 TaxID=1671482 RepID=UPI00191BBCAA|nr:cobalt-precorrin-5B (C(1))-methyltransferase [Acidithrix sp. C25]
MSPTPVKNLKSGWTTGTCASAAAKASAIAFCTAQKPNEIEVPLPDGSRVSFMVGWNNDQAFVIKDAGDDPDCTHGAMICASLTQRADEEISFLAGDGVGVITKEGLGLPLGDPAINPVPRRMIAQAIREVSNLGFIVTISVPGGQEMAKKTTNDRLGIVGGISILGTTGIVRPFSTAAYRASVVQQIDVAAAQGANELCLATGSRSEAFAISKRPDLDLVSFVEIGDFTKIALKRANHYAFEKVTWVGMVGKVTKIASGFLMTHFHRSALDTTILDEVSKMTTTNSKILTAATATETARHFYEVCIGEGEIAPLDELTRRAYQNCKLELPKISDFQMVMCDFDGSMEICRAH